MPVPQSHEFYTALRTLDAPCAFVHDPHGGHALREPRHRADQTVSHADVVRSPGALNR